MVFTQITKDFDRGSPVNYKKYSLKLDFNENFFFHLKQNMHDIQFEEEKCKSLIDENSCITTCN